MLVLIVPSVEVAMLSLPSILLYMYYFDRGLKYTSLRSTCTVYPLFHHSSSTWYTISVNTSSHSLPTPFTPSVYNTKSVFYRSNTVAVHGILLVLTYPLTHYQLHIYIPSTLVPFNTHDLRFFSCCEKLVMKDRLES